MRKQTVHVVMKSLCSLALVGAVGSLSAQTVHATNPSKKVVFCSEASPEFFAPSISTTGTSFDANLPIYDTLVRYIRGSTRLAPSLAERWEISRDGTEYVFYLRRGVQWHRNALFQPTRDFNADDVLFMFERQWKPDDPYHRVSSSNHSVFNSMGLGQLLKSVEKIDDYTVKITLHQASTPFLPALAQPFAGIQSKEYAIAMIKRGQPETIDINPIGTGPFEFVRYEKDHAITYRAFKEYWRGRPSIDELEFLITPGAEQRWQRLQEGRCHLMPFPNPAQLDEMRQNPGVKVHQQPGLDVGYLAYNTLKAPFSDVRVRRAINMAINKEAIVQAVFKGTGTTAVNPIPPTMWSYNRDTQPDVYDPQAAKQLLAQAGFPNGFQTDLWAMPTARGYNPNPQLMAQMIQADLARVGVQAQIKTFEWSDYYHRMTMGEHTMGLLGWTGSNGDPDYFFGNLLTCEAAQPGGSNVAKFCYAPYDELVLRARKIANPVQRIPLYEQAQRIFREQAPWLPIAHAMQTVVFRNEVLNFRASPFGFHDFYGVDLAAQPQSAGP